MPVMPWTALPMESAPTILGHDEEYDAVVLDLGLPRMDGLTVLRHGAKPVSRAGDGADGARKLARKGHGH